MTKFEEQLIDKGYLTHTFNCSTNKYERGRKAISTMTNLDNRYINKDTEKEICFGLNEFGKPPTLISPRPRIEIKRLVDGCIIIEDEFRDDSMNIILREKSFKEIYEAMYDKSIILKIDLTKKF